MIQYEKTSLNPIVNGLYVPKWNPTFPITSLKFNANGFTGLVPQKVKAKLEFEYDKASLVEEIEGTIQAGKDGREVAFDPEKIRKMLTSITSKIPMKEGLPLSPNPLDAPLVSKKVTLSLGKEDPIKGVLYGPVEVTGKLTIEFKPEVKKD